MPSDAGLTLWDTCIEVLLIGLLAFMPAALGAVEPWSELVVLAMVTAACLCLCVRLAFSSGPKFVWTWAYLPIVLFVGLAAIQLVPLPDPWLGCLSAETFKIWKDVIADLGSGASRATLSIYPEGTVRTLRLILAAAAVFILVLNVFRRPEQVKRLLAAISLIGGVAALLAIAQIATGATDIYWTLPTPSAGVVTGGTFVNRGHFAQHINLSVGAALGLLLVLHRESAVSDAEALRWGGAGYRVSATLKVKFLFAFVVIGLLAVTLSLSRGGVMAALAALGVTLALVAARRRTSGYAMVVVTLAFAVIAITFYFGFDGLYERFRSAKSEQFGGRLRMLQDLKGLYGHFPIFGTGLGTFQFVFPMVDTATSGLVATHAENEYAQVLAEMGVVGVALVVAFVLILAFHFVRCVRRSTSAMSAAAFGLGFGLIATMVHSASDFGQHFPAIACLSAVMGGLLISLNRMPTPAAFTHAKQRLSAGDSTNDLTPTPTRMISRWPARVAGLILTFGITGAMAWTIPEANKSRRAANHWDGATELAQALATSGWQGAEEDYATLIREAAAAAELRQGDVTYRYGLNAYRWRSVVQFHEVNSDGYIEYAKRLVAELHKARLLCPTFGPPCALAGQLEAFVLDDLAGQGHIRLGFRFAPIDAAACFAAGKLAAQQQDWDASLIALRRAIKIDGTLLQESKQIYLRQCNRPDLAIALVDDEPSALLTLAEELERNPSGEAGTFATRPATAGAVAREKAIALLSARCAVPEASPSDLVVLADILQERSDFLTAAEYYHRALATDFLQVDWRIRLARALAASKQYESAFREAQTCLRLRPNMLEAQNLMEEIIAAQHGQGRLP